MGGKESSKICDILQSFVYAVVIDESTELTIEVLDRNIFLVGPFLKFVLLWQPPILDSFLKQKNGHFVENHPRNISVNFAVKQCKMVLLYSDKNSFKIFISYCLSQNLSYSGGHFGFPIHTKIENFERDHPMIIQVQFGFNQIFSF